MWRPLGVRPVQVLAPLWYCAGGGSRALSGAGWLTFQVLAVAERGFGDTLVNE